MRIAPTLHVVVTAVLFSVSPVHADTAGSQLVTVTPSHVFAPPGFDDNDPHTEVMVTGYLPSTCYKMGAVDYKIDTRKKTITLKAQAHYFPGSWCVFALVPYTVPVDFRRLKANDYTIQAETEKGEIQAMGNLPVAISTNQGPDDHLYASVKDIGFAGKPQNGKAMLRIEGTLGNSCMFLDEIKILKRKNDVIEVLPLAETREGEICMPILKPFIAETEVEIESATPFLVHVRSLNGMALNRIFEFEN